MKKTKYLIIALIMLMCTATVKAASEGPFYFDWENSRIENAIEMQSLFNENLSFKKGSIVIQTILDENASPTTKITKYDAKGNEITTNSLEKTAFYSAITDDTNIYLVVISSENEESVQKLIKLDENLELVQELSFDEEYTPAVDGMINARVFGHDILAIKDDYLYVFCGEEYMLKTKLDLSKWENMEYSKTLFAKYFPDLSAEYDLLYIWMEKLFNGNVTGDYLDMEVTTHVYEDKMISSGMRYYVNTGKATDSMPFAGFIRIKDNSGKVIFEEVNNDYAKIIEARIIGDYVVAVALVEGSIGMSYTNSPYELGNDIIVYNMDGELVQTIETEGSYVFLNEINSGFIATHVESCEETTNDIIIEGLMAKGETTSSKTCTYNTEAYYLPLEVKTKVTGKGSIEAISNTRKDEEITFKVTPEKGYVLSEVKVTDENGNVVIFTDYTFTMPNSNVLIEAIFVPENPNTSDVAIIGLIIISIFGFIAVSFSSKKINWLN